VRQVVSGKSKKLRQVVSSRQVVSKAGSKWKIEKIEAGSKFEAGSK
jgi:hypothetical protein